MGRAFRLLLLSWSRRIYGEEGTMSANLEKAIQEEVRELTDDQQRQVMAFVESLKPNQANKRTKSYSFIAIARSGNGSLSTEAESILGEAADRREGWSLR